MSALCSAVRQTLFGGVSPLNVLYEKSPHPETFKSNCLWHAYVYLYIFKFYFIYFSSWYPVLSPSLFSLTFMWPFLASFSFHQVGTSIRGAFKPAEPPFGWDVLLCCHFEDACFDEEPESWEALLEEKSKYNTLNANRYLHTLRLGISSHLV